MNNIQPGLPLKLVHRGFTTRTDIDMDVLAMDTMTRKDLTLQSLYFNHSQRISVVTGTSSVYGVLEETRLTSTHPFNIPKPGITLGNVQEKP